MALHGEQQAARHDDVNNQADLLTCKWKTAKVLMFFHPDRYFVISYKSEIYSMMFHLKVEIFRNYMEYYLDTQKQYIK